MTLHSSARVNVEVTHACTCVYTHAHTCMCGCTCTCTCMDMHNRLCQERWPISDLKKIHALAHTFCPPQSQTSTVPYHAMPPPPPTFDQQKVKSSVRGNKQWAWLCSWWSVAHFRGPVCVFWSLYGQGVSKSSPKIQKLINFSTGRLMTKPRPLAAIRNRRLNSVALLVPLRSDIK